MKKIILKIFLLTLLCIVIPCTLVFAEDITTTQSTIEEQKEEFGIQDFINNSKQYMEGEFFNNIDIGQVLNDAIQGDIDNNSILKAILSMFGTEFISSIKAIVSILAIIVIHSLLKSISESLENDSIAKLIYYVQYILIVTIVMSNFAEIITMVKETTINLVAFMNMLVPLLITLMMYTGSITTSGVIEPIILFMINFVGNIIQNIILPLVLIFTSLVVLSKLTDKIQISKLSKFLQSGIVWFLGIILTIFVGVVSLEGTMSSSVDGITAKTTKAVVSSAVPVVGKILGDAVDTVLGGGIILKNAIGLVGVIIVIGMCIAPILKLAILCITYKFLATITQPIADSNITGLLEQIGDIFKILLAILASIAFMLIIGTALVLKISNGGMMYR